MDPVFHSMENKNVRNFEYTIISGKSYSLVNALPDAIGPYGHDLLLIIPWVIKTMSC